MFRTLNSRLTLVLLSAAILGYASCKKGDSCTEKFIGNWYGPIHVASCVGAVSVAIKQGVHSCEVLLPNLPDGSSCGNSHLDAMGTVTGDTLFILSQPFGADSVSGYGVVNSSELTLQVNVSNGSHVVISGTRQ
jgi:hypothetical protein